MPSRQAVEALTERKLEQRVVDVVAGSSRMQTAGGVGSDALRQQALDEEEHVLELARIGCRLLTLREFVFDGIEREQDGRHLVGGKQVLFGQHDAMRAVKLQQMAKVVTLPQRESRRQDALGEGRGREPVAFPMCEPSRKSLLMAFNPSTRRERRRG